MGNVALLISAIASMISSVGGVAAFLYTARRTSRLERERAAEHAAERLLHPADAAILEAAVESMFHHPHELHGHHEHTEGHHQEGEQQ